jgi:hypothetical protein
VFSNVEPVHTHTHARTHALEVVGGGTYGLGTTFLKYQMFMTARLLGARWNSTVLGKNLMRRLKVHAV